MPLTRQQRGQRAAKVGGIFDQIITGINTGIQVTGAVQSATAHGSGAPGAGAVVRDGDVAQLIDRLAAEYHDIQRQNNVQAALQAAQALLAAFSDPKQFAPQNAGGQAYLAQAKTVLQKDIDTYTRALAGQVLAPAGSAPVQTVVNAQGQMVNAVTGQPVSVPMVSGIPNNYLLAAGGAVVLLLLLRGR